MANPFSSLLQKLGLKRAPEGVVPPQQPAGTEGAKAPSVEGMNWANTSFENASNVTKGVSESGIPFAVVEKPVTSSTSESAVGPMGSEAVISAPITPEAPTPVGAAMGGGEAKG